MHLSSIAAANIRLSKAQVGRLKTDKQKKMNISRSTAPMYVKPGVGLDHKSAKT